MHRRVAIVTDSTASVPPRLAEQLGITVVQLELRVGDEYNDERRVPHARLAQAMREGTAVETSPPPVPAFFWNYSDAVAEGAEAIVSIHLSETLSQTCEAARTAAAEIDVPVHVVDSKLCGLGIGYPVIAAAESAAAGATAQGVLGVLERRLRNTTQLFYVDTLEYLRRGGRIGKRQAAIGRALSAKPILRFKEGALEPLVKGIGTERALRHAISAAVERAGSGPVDIATEHFEAGQRAESVLEELRENLPEAGKPLLAETSAVIGAHTGPGAVGITVSPR